MKLLPPHSYQPQKLSPSSFMQVKKVIIVVDATTNGIWAFMWFVAFCFAADQWRRQDHKSFFTDAATNCARAGIAFAFFCFLIWVCHNTVHVAVLGKLMVQCGVEI